MANSVSVQTQTVPTVDSASQTGNDNALEHAKQPLRSDSERLPAEHLPNSSLLNQAKSQHSANDFSSPESPDASKKPTESKTGDMTDMAAFQKQSEKRALEQMQLQEHMAKLAERTKIHAAILEQNQRDVDSITKYALASSKIGAEAAERFINHH